MRKRFTELFQIGAVPFTLQAHLLCKSCGNSRVMFLVWFCCFSTRNLAWSFPGSLKVVVFLPPYFLSTRLRQDRLADFKHNKELPKVSPSMLISSSASVCIIEKDPDCIQDLFASIHHFFLRPHRGLFVLWFCTKNQVSSTFTKPWLITLVCATWSQNQAFTACLWEPHLPSVKAWMWERVLVFLDGQSRPAWERCSACRTWMALLFPTQMLFLWDFCDAKRAVRRKKRQTSASSNEKQRSSVHRWCMVQCFPLWNPTCTHSSKGV